MENPIVAIKANVAFLRRDAAYSLELSWQLGYCRRNSQHINLRSHNVQQGLNDDKHCLSLSFSLFVEQRANAGLRVRG